MRLPLALALALLAAAPLTPAQVCSPTTRPERQFRTTMKHRAPGDFLRNASHFGSDIGDMLTWSPPVGVASAAVRTTDAPIDPHESGIEGFTGTSGASSKQTTATCTSS